MVETLCLLLGTLRTTSPPAHRRRRSMPTRNFDAGCPATLARGDSLQPAGPRQAAAADAGAAGGRSVPGHRRCRAAGGLRRGNGARLFADPRRSAGDGRRRSAPRPADVPQGVRRGDGDSGRRRAVGAGLRSAGARHATRQPWPPQCCAVLAQAAGATQLVGGQADDLAGAVRTPDSTRSKSIHRRKTGAMFLVSLQLGALAAGADDCAARAPGSLRPKSGAGVSDHRRFARRARLEPRRWAKRTGKDRSRGKLTFPGVLGIDESVRRAEALVAEACAAIAASGSACGRPGSAGPLCSGKESLMDKLLSDDRIAARSCRPVDSPSSNNWPAKCARRCAIWSRNRTAHFASNLGVVELCLALHTTFDFSRDRLIWDTGHQIYPHKLITGRYHEFGTMRTKGGLMGYPNPAESEYDLFMTGHAGCSVSTALGLKSGDDLMPGQDDRHSVAVIGDGAFPSGIVYEAMNNAGGLRKKLLVDPQRQSNVDLPARRRHGRISRPPADELVLHRAEERSAQGPQQGAAVRRSGRAAAGAGQRSGQGRPARRHAVRGAGLPLHRPDRRPQHSAAVQVSEDGQGRRRARCCCTW